MFSAEQLTLGQYKKDDTSIHKLDARVKLICLLILAWSAFYWVSGTFLVLLATVIAIKLSKLPYGLIFKWLRTLKWFLIFTFLFHLIATPGYFIPYLSWMESGITYEGLINGSLISLRLILLLMVSSLLTLTTSPTRLVDGLERLFAPLAKIGVPVQDIAMMIMLSLHFIPILWQEAERIRKTQIARGVTYQQGNIIQRGKQLIPMLTPLVLNAFHRADKLALAMEIRYYHSAVPRTSLHPSKLRAFDYMVLVTVMFIPVFALILGR